jgi:hypothetical protein
MTAYKQEYPSFQLDIQTPNNSNQSTFNWCVFLSILRAAVTFDH